MHPYGSLYLLKSDLLHVTEIRTSIVQLHNLCIGNYFVSSCPLILAFFCRAKLEGFLLRSMEDGLVADGVIAQDISQASNFWRIREVMIR
jgi:hypothetical protein